MQPTEQLRCSMKQPAMIPANYWRGLCTLEYEYPWLTPGSIAALDELITPAFKVLEFGCGGSTLFFSRRCKEVLSFETNSEWGARVQNDISEKQINNVDLHLVSSLEQCVDIIGERQFDLVLVDCDDIRRLDLTKTVKAHVAAGGLLVIDNYDHFGCEHLDVSYFCGWGLATFDDPYWLGRGTRIFSRDSSRPGFSRICHTRFGIPRRALVRLVRKLAARIARLF